MALMSAELYDALLDAGASEEKARKGAEAVASHDQRFTSLESTMDQRFASLEGKMDTRFASLEGKMDTHFASLEGKFDTLRAQFDTMKWMMGTVLVLLLGVLWKVIKL